MPSPALVCSLAWEIDRDPHLFKSVDSYDEGGRPLMVGYRRLDLEAWPRSEEEKTDRMRTPALQPGYSALDRSSTFELFWQLALAVYLIRVSEKQNDTPGCLDNPSRSKCPVAPQLVARTVKPSSTVRKIQGHSPF
uniref:Uncharacterized protein n=1 Tax=Coccidioides posadasii RMSCC 3488 TaxID=454284 RepID=A0A0J6IG89_COCPO|nr:hypothetical protein CPAG_07143 [Coccidioides posadasii RMSCC 3488]